METENYIIICYINKSLKINIFTILPYEYDESKVKW